MARKRHKPEEIVAKLRQVDVLTGQGRSISEAVKTIAVTETTYFRWRAEYGGMKNELVKRLKALELENTRLRRAVSDLTLDKLILTEAAQGDAIERAAKHVKRTNHELRSPEWQVSGRGVEAIRDPSLSFAVSAPKADLMIPFQPAGCTPSYGQSA
jgi:putative transposase